MSRTKTLSQRGGRTPDTHQLSPAVAARRTFCCEAYSGKCTCQYNRCVQLTRGSHLSRDGCDAQMVSFSLRGDPSGLLLPIGQRWPWGTSRSVRGKLLTEAEWSKGFVASSPSNQGQNPTAHWPTIYLDRQSLDCPKPQPSLRTVRISNEDMPWG